MDKLKKCKWIVLILVTLLSLSGCTATKSTTVVTSSSEESAKTSSEFFTTDTIHELAVEFSEDEYQEMLTAYEATGTKNWLQATVKIDGTTFENVGIKLKGNSTLRGLKSTQSTNSSTKEAEQSTTEETNASATAERGEPSNLDSEEPETIPWVIRLDKYEKGVSYAGRSYFVIRANNTATSLNEAVALSMLNEGGVEAEDFAFTRFSVNGSAEKLRLVLDVPDDDLWTEEHFGTETTGYLYKADGSGDYSYRGTEETAYTDVFDQKYGDANLTPVMTFLEFINNSTAEDFTEKLPDYLDVDAFATYLAGQELIQNTDDIDGPGNNSYLYYNEGTKKMTVVAWDHNLSFGGFGGGQGMGGGGTPPDQEGAERPTMPMDGGGETPPDMPDGENKRPEMDPANAAGERPEMKEGGAMGGDQGMGGKDNPLVTRFLADETFKKLYEEKLADLTTNLVANEFASTVLKEYESLLVAQATDLITEEKIIAESNAIQQALTGDNVPNKETKTE